MIDIKNLNVIETKDGVPIKLFATVKNKSNAIYANQVGIKSAGLISTEFFQPIDSFEKSYAESKGYL
ncbi:hypothetical protein GN277_10515 [Lachnospiraceae bacterium WCA-9-b2]|uniref:Uncharacterized protein n=1 Tax=Sporofaciens musculi TaxID=2681861 RepID=A0A7X3MG25_9FIRM|nr:hypothetical protein [Sporofaciens musculi]MXP75795.1 hypothetical protein [Sporofaciens musculi]